MSKKKGGSMPVALLISVIWLGVNYYIYYPAINIQNQEFWFWLLFHSVVISLIFICRDCGKKPEGEIHRWSEEEFPVFYQRERTGAVDTACIDTGILCSGIILW